MKRQAKPCQDVGHKVFFSLPPEMQTLSPQKLKQDEILMNSLSASMKLRSIEKICATITPEATAQLLPILSGPARLFPIFNQNATRSQRMDGFYWHVVSKYIFAVSAGTLQWEERRSCEICFQPASKSQNNEVHHLIPQAVAQEAAVEYGYGPEKMNEIAWLCRECHQLVHSTASNIELAEKYHTIPLLLQKTNIGGWASFRRKAQPTEGSCPPQSASELDTRESLQVKIASDREMFGEITDTLSIRRTQSRRRTSWRNHPQN